MFVDASAIVAVITREKSCFEIARVLSVRKAQLFGSAIAEHEATLAIARKSRENGLPYSKNIKEAGELVREFWFSFDVKIEPITDEHSKLVEEATRQYGHGSGHQAKLNMGDCFAYAMAKSLKVPLLFVGDDFIHTDIESVLPDPRP